MFIRKDRKEREYDLDKGYNLGAAISGNILWLELGLIVDFIAAGAYAIKPVNIRLNEPDGNSVTDKKRNKNLSRLLPAK